MYCSQDDKNNRHRRTIRQASESDPLLMNIGTGIVRSRRTSRSPVQVQHNTISNIAETERPMIASLRNEDDGFDAEHDGYESIEEATVRSQQLSASDDEDPFTTRLFKNSSEKRKTCGVSGDKDDNDGSGSHRSLNSNTNAAAGGGVSTSAIQTQGSLGSGSEQPPLLEIPEEIYAVRKAALQVLKPLNKTWVSYESLRF